MDLLAYKTDLCWSELWENSLRPLIFKEKIHVSDVMIMNSFNSIHTSYLPQYWLYCFQCL